jgi:hypothetical protein
VCRKIREDVALAHTGVVMLTGIGENLNQMTSPLYGADAYIDKPFEFGELDEKVKTALSARAAQREGVNRPATNGVLGAINVDAGTESDFGPARAGTASPRPPKAKASAKRKPTKKPAKKAAKKAMSAKAPKKAGTKAAKKKAARKPAKKASSRRPKKAAKRAAKRGK